MEVYRSGDAASNIPMAPRHNGRPPEGHSTVYTSTVQTEALIWGLKLGVPIYLVHTPYMGLERVREFLYKG